MLRLEQIVVPYVPGAKRSDETRRERRDRRLLETVDRCEERRSWLREGFLRLLKSGGSTAEVEDQHKRCLKCERACLKALDLL